MEIVPIAETALKAILGYAIMFGVIALLSLPFIYSVLLYERIKERTLFKEEKLENPFRFLQGSRRRHRKEGFRQNLLKLRKEIQEQREEITKISDVNRQLMSIVIKMRNDLRDY
tara:strand:+ start:1191 stop:1532 length:342 start_codon:yes stop_codon:yes gene_type:complete